MMDGFFNMGPVFWVIIGIALVWSLVWKGIALWKAGRNKQLGWFIWMLILNTEGILPILYLAFYQKESPEAKMLRRLEKKK